ncbi:Protein of unknown function [Kaistia soli DSM 19436]|uniref:DUF2937 family protein n=1 Tax=Kaistia soli DSM 19436 TaxID=1122133 RepID=A0A1M5JCF9_9HYPH|nr:DUF2937 family protein [Kaistia soli]SHG38055.1 Protein of unknown function [Kaistia soli DSM 19436]
MIGRTALLAAAVFGGVIASQAPEFAQQYRQRLGGAVDELRRVVADFDRDAATVGLDRERAIASLLGDDTRLVQLRGASTAASVERYERLTAQQAAFEASGPLGRVEAVLRAPDRDLVDATWDSYEPAVPTTTAGAVTAALGFVVVYIIAACCRLATVPFRRRRRIRDRRETA